MGRDAGGILLDAEEKFRTDEYRAKPHLNARLEVLLRPRVFVELERDPQVRVGHRPPISAAHQRREDAFGTAVFVTGMRRPTHEYPATARCVAGTFRLVRAVDGDGVHSRLDTRMPVHIKVRLVRLSLGFQQY